MSPSSLDHFPQPDGNDADTIDAALQALRTAHDASTATDACDALLWAVGDNHAGTFYPVVLGVLPELGKILESGTPWAQHAAIEALIDLAGTFVPQPGHETYLGSPVQQTLRAFVQALRPHVAPLAAGDGAQAGSAAELLELIDDQAA